MSKNEWETYLLDSAGNKKPIPESGNEWSQPIGVFDTTQFPADKSEELEVLKSENKTLAKELERVREILIERLELEVKKTQKLEGENNFLLDRLQFEVKRTQSLRESIRKAREVLKDDQ